MKCPVCHKDMKKVRWEITNNLKEVEFYKEYDKVTYKCRDDDVWITTEIPIAEKSASKPAK